MKVAQLCPTLCDPMDCSPWNSPGQNTGVSSLCLLQGILPTQGSNPCLPHCRWILYQLSHMGQFYKPTAVQYCMADAVSWVPEQTLLGLTNKTKLMHVFLEWNSVISRGLLPSFAIHKVTNLKGRFLGRLSPYSDVSPSRDIIDASSQKRKYVDK